jgi:subtilase family serine protease
MARVLVPGAVDKATIGVALPSGLAPGDWFFIARADADAQVVERNESNNERTRPLVVRP